ncbi:type II toxin-antitoxin system RelE/ParE family toxin [Rhizobium sp. S163]|uniref:type II toxin-antitoxin system RelE/ParE family toxin n=1 Tax=Rhizobium sp. S163 TaxID=3055039 RepID=UPI0025A986DE|nr:type II toxin-antitoxin system RelE/ParE family toxin [Rhizobium sp. S163]MDM9647614.1 type II toxin-antitoxin system RelE/ParE family toxin [Rhizobium sp. S163]
MAYRVTRHPLVKNDLLDITILVGEYAGDEVAEDKIDLIEQKLRSLADFPRIGTIRSDLYPGLRAIPASEKATVCFTVNDEAQSVFVLCISYGGADWQARVRDRQ